MVNYSDFTNDQKQETESPVIVALPYDFYEHVVQQNKRDDESRMEYHAPKEPLRTISYPETCDRCGKDLNRVYVWNRKRLCKSCVKEEQNTWVLFTGGPDAHPQRVYAGHMKKAKERSLVNSLISEFLALFGLKRITKETLIVGPKVPINRAARQAVQRPDKKQMPEAEGIMNRKRRLRPTSGPKPY
jgi:hypothetical protein